MELKTRYQYTYFIHNFTIKENRYSKYILKLLKDERFNLKIFEKNKDLDIYTYFLPKMRDFLFKTFELNDKQKYAKFIELPIDTQAAILSKYPSCTFEYELKKDMQGKTVDENSIFFKIQKVGIITFNTGIGFLYLKTNIEGSEEFSDILNFNYKFRDINQEYNNLRNYDNIKVQADYFDNIQALQDFISDLTGPNIDALKINLDVERFNTYSYACIKQDAWNSNKSFDNIQNEFFKYVNILPADSNTNSLLSENIKVISNSKYSKVGISKLGVTLLSSECDINNYTVLPEEFETQYFYTYIIALYLKVYLKKLNYEFKSGKDIKLTRKEFVDFSKKLWIQEITSSDIGSLFYKYIKEVLEIDKLYNELKNKYNILYSELKIEKNERMSGLIILVLVATLVVNIINFIMYFNT